MYDKGYSGESTGAGSSPLGAQCNSRYSDTAKIPYPEQASDLSGLRVELNKIISDGETGAYRAQQARELRTLLNQHPELERFMALLVAVNPSSIR